MTKELHKKYRPRTFEELMGNEAAVKLLQGKLGSGNFPHALLLCGPTGSGKTTIARILRKELNVHKSDFIELNASNDRGIDVIRLLTTGCRMSSLTGGNKIYLLDECFASGTIISTDKGGVRIEKVKVGDRIHNLAGFGKVTHIFTKNIPLERLVKVTFLDGGCFYCSDGHEIFTSRGWIHAKDLIPGDLTYSKLSDMMLYSKSLNEGVANESMLGMPKSFDEKAKNVLLQELSGKEQVQEAGNKSKVVFTGSEGKTEQNKESFLPDRTRKDCCCGAGGGYEKDKPHVKSKNSGKDEVGEGHKWDSSHVERGTWREWETDRTSNPVVRNSKMAHGSGNCHGKDSIRGISSPLQSGFGEYSLESGSGDRRAWAFIEKQFVERYEEAGTSGKIGVESVAFYERGSNEEDFLGVVGDKEKNEGFVTLYDLSVDSHPSYFAEGVAVHNCHQLTKAAQEALLKVLEDTPKHVYFILATTDPQNLGKAILSRCTTIKLEPLAPKLIRQLLHEIAEAEDQDIDDTVVQEISRLADGLPREAVKLLDGVLGMDAEEAFNALASIKTSEATVKDLCKELMGQANWKTVQPMLTNLAVDPEGSRLAILGYFSAIALKNCDTLLVELMRCFVDNYFSSGRAGLVIDCFTACAVARKIKGGK